MKCKNCGREIPANSRKCPYCNSAVQASTFDTSEFKWMSYDYPNSPKPNEIVIDWKNGKILDKNAGMIYDQSVNGWIEPENLNDLFSFDEVVESRQKSLDSELARANSKNAESGRSLRGMRPSRERSSSADDFSDLLDDDYIEGFLDSLHDISGDIYGSGTSSRNAHPFAQDSQPQTQAPVQNRSFAWNSQSSQAQAPRASQPQAQAPRASQPQTQAPVQKPEFDWSAQILTPSQQEANSQSMTSFDIPSFAADPYAASSENMKESSQADMPAASQAPANRRQTGAPEAHVEPSVYGGSQPKAEQSNIGQSQAEQSKEYSEIEYDPATGTFRLIEDITPDKFAAEPSPTSGGIISSSAEEPAARSKADAADTPGSADASKSSDAFDSHDATDVSVDSSLSAPASGGFSSFGLMFDEIIENENDFIEKLNIAEKADSKVNDTENAGTAEDGKKVSDTAKSTEKFGDKAKVDDTAKADGTVKADGDNVSDSVKTDDTVKTDETAKVAGEAKVDGEKDSASSGRLSFEPTVKFRSISERYDDFLNGGPQGSKAEESESNIAPTEEFAPKKKNVEININEPSGTAVTVKTQETPAHDPDEDTENLKTRKVNLKNIKKAQKNLEMTVEVSATNRDASVKVTRTPDGSTVVKTSDAPGFGRVYVNGEEVKNNPEADSFVNVTSNSNDDSSDRSIPDAAVADAIKTAGDANAADASAAAPDAKTADSADDAPDAKVAAEATGIADTTPAIDVTPDKAEEKTEDKAEDKATDEAAVAPSIIAEATAAEEAIQTDENAVANGLASGEAAQHTMNIPGLNDDISERILKAKQTLNQVESSIRDDFDSLDDFWDRKVDSKKLTITDIFGENAHEIMEQGLSGKSEASEADDSAETSGDSKSSGETKTPARKSNGNTFMDIRRADIMPSRSQTSAIVMPTIDPEEERGLKSEVISDERKAEMEQELSALDDLNSTKKERFFGFGRKKKNKGKKERQYDLQNDSQNDLRDELQSDLQDKPQSESQNKPQSKPQSKPESKSQDGSHGMPHGKDVAGAESSRNEHKKTADSAENESGNKPSAASAKSQKSSAQARKNNAPVLKKSDERVKKFKKPRYDEPDDFDLDDDDDESIGPVAKVIAIILCILLVAEFAIIGIKLLAPESGIASVIVKIEESVSGIFSHEESSTQALCAPDTSSEILMLPGSIDSSGL